MRHIHHYFSDIRSAKWLASSSDSIERVRSNARAVWDAEIHQQAAVFMGQAPE
jgi:hypothetical protein